MTDTPQPASKLSRILRNSGFLVVGNLSFMVGQWAIMAMIAKTGDLAALGFYALALNLIRPVFFLANFRLQHAYLSDESGLYHFEVYRRFRQICAVLSVVVAAVVAVLWERADLFLLFAAVMIIEKWAEFRSDFMYGVMQRDNAYFRCGMTIGARGILGAVAFAIGLYGLGWEILPSFCLTALVWIAIWFFHDGPYRPEHELAERPAQISGDSLKGLLRRVLPLGFSGMASASATAATPLVLDYYHSVELVGVFGSLLLFFTAGQFAVETATNALVPPLAKHWKEGRVRAFLKLVVQFAGMAVVCGVIGVAAAWAIGEQVLRLFYTAEIAAYAPVLTLLAVAVAVQVVGAVTRKAVLATGNYGYRLTIDLVGFSTVLVAALIMIPEQSIEGAGWAVISWSIAQTLTAVWLIFVLVRQRAS